MIPVLVVTGLLYAAVGVAALTALGTGPRTRRRRQVLAGLGIAFYVLSAALFVEALITLVVLP